jgi:hypothetical protein
MNGMPPTQPQRSWAEYMRVLIYIEPVVFRANPIAGITWVRDWAMALVSGLSEPDTCFALASSLPILELVRTQIEQLKLQEFPIPSWQILAACDYLRDRYNIALFEESAAQQALAGNGPLAPLATQLVAVNRAFAPDLVFGMGENRLLPQVFQGAHCLWLDRAPFLRQKRPDRLTLDPCGHLVGSVLERAADRLRELEVDAQHLPQLEALWRVMEAPTMDQWQMAGEVRDAIRSSADGRRVALLVLQPTDWFSWEGCLGCSVSPEAMLAQWAVQLPADWVGIPLYKAHAQLPALLEQSLAEAFPQLAFLPAELSGNVAALALQEADAVITVSSSMAGQALISGKQVVVTGRTSLRALSHTRVTDLSHNQPTLSRDQRLALLAFLSHRYIFTLDEIADPTGSFPTHLQNLITSADPISWLLDLSDWSPAKLARLL